LQAELLRVAPPLVGELEEQSAAAGIFGGLGGAGAVVGVTFVELGEGQTTI
jgi:hypothetical protein